MIDGTDTAQTHADAFARFTGRSIDLQAGYLSLQGICKVGAWPVFDFVRPDGDNGTYD